MNARAVDDAATRLRELRHEQWEDLGLAGLALGLALAATRLGPTLAMPLLLGGFAVGVLGLRALWRRWDLVDRLAGEREAYLISEVRAYALREATMERRESFAAVIRGTIRQAELASDDRVTEVADELEVLARELEDGELTLDLSAAVSCLRLVSDHAESPLFNPERPREELRWRIRQIRSGFAPRRLTA